MWTDKRKEPGRYWTDAEPYAPAAVKQWQNYPVEVFHIVTAEDRTRLTRAGSIKITVPIDQSRLASPDPAGALPKNPPA